MSKKSLSLNEMGIDMSKVDEKDRDNIRLNMNASAIPDLDELLLNVQDLLDYIDTPDVQRIENRNRDEFEEVVCRFQHRLLIPQLRRSAPRRPDRSTTRH